MIERFGFCHVILEAIFPILCQLLLLMTSVFFLALLGQGGSRGTSSLRFRATTLDGEYVSVPRLATNKEWFYGGFSYPASYSIKLFPAVFPAVFVTLNVMYYKYPIACIHQLANCTLLKNYFTLNARVSVNKKR